MRPHHVKIPNHFSKHNIQKVLSNQKNFDKKKKKLVIGPAQPYQSQKEEKS